MNIPQSARLEGLHRRHHLNRGIKKPGCTFCEMPSLGTKKGDKTVAVLPPVQEVDHYAELTKEAERNANKLLEKERIWALAMTGLSALDASTVMEIPIQLFTGLVESHFKKCWADVLHQARLCNKRDLSLAAVKAAQNGDTRLLIRLSDRGFFDSWLCDERQESIRSATTEELQERMFALFPAVRSRYEAFQSDSLKVMPATTDDIRDFESGKPVEYKENETSIVAAANTIPESSLDTGKERIPDKAEVKNTNDVEARSVSNDSPRSPAVYYGEPAPPLNPFIER